MTTTHEYAIPVSATLLRLHLREQHGEDERNIDDEWSTLVARHESYHPEVEERRRVVREQATPVVTLPDATPRPCNDCPWRRSSLPGWLGPMGPDEWIALARSDEPVACHETIRRVDEHGEGDWSDPQIRQCRGAAIFRANTFKSPRDPDVARTEPDRESVFARADEFIEHHSGAYAALRKVRP